MTDTLTLEHFTPCIGSEFACPTPDGGAYLLTLREAESAGHSRAKEARQPFSLIFLGPLEPVLAQGTYSLEHPTLVTLPIFIVPVGRETAGVCYQAIFS